MISVQRARPDDYEQLLALRLAFKEEALPFHPELVDAGPEETGWRLKDWLGHDSTVVLAAFMGDEIVGYLHLFPGNCIGTNPEGVRSDEFYVTPRHRGSRAAVALWRAAKAVTEDILPVSFQICVLENNRAVQRLMEKRGFKKVASIYQKRVEQQEEDHDTSRRPTGISEEVYRTSSSQS